MESSNFLGRARELMVLEQAYALTRTEFIPMYGRRRVGKSELILHFVRNKPHLYFLGKQGTAGPQIWEFLQETARVFGQEFFASLEVNDWQSAFKIVLAQRARSCSSRSFIGRS